MEIRRIANYNLRPRKRKNLVEPKGRAKKFIRVDTSNGKLTKGICLIPVGMKCDVQIFGLFG